MLLASQQCYSVLCVEADQVILHRTASRQRPFVHTVQSGCTLWHDELLRSWLAAVLLLEIFECKYHITMRADVNVVRSEVANCFSSRWRCAIYAKDLSQEIPAAAS